MNTTNLSKSDGYVLGVLVQLDKLGLIHQKFLLSIVASYRKKGYLSQQQISYARSILIEHYSEQISKLKNVPNLKAEKGNKNKPRLASSSGAKAIRLQFGRQSDVLSVVSGLSGARYRNRGPGDCFWVVKKSVAAYQLLSNLGFSFDEPLQDWYAEAKKIGGIKKIPGLKTELRAYQKHAVGFFDARKGRALLADDMGLGKTIQVLAWLQKNKETAIPALVVCPNSVKINWARETVKHTRLLPLILDGRPKKNGLDFLRKELSEKHVIIVNYDVIANTKTKNGEISGWGSVLTKAGIKTVVADECQYLQNGKSKRTKSFRFIQRKAKHFLPLSGKPITNKPIEFWPVLNMLDRAVFHDWFWFVKRYCDGKKDHWNRWDVSGSSNTEEFHELLNNTYMLRRTKAEVLTELPAKNRIVLPMEISNRKEYEEALLNFQEWMVSQGKPPTQTAMTKIEMLKQIAVRGKIPQVSEWISEFLDGGEKLAVFCTHHFAIDELKNIFGKVAVKLDGRDNGNKRQAAIDSFVHDKKTRLFIGQLAAAGVGIDGLQRVCSTTCFVELGWTSAAHDQAEDRVHRFGQEAQTVSAYYPIAENTIEEDIIDAIDRKRILLDMIMDGEDTSDESLLSELLAKMGG